MSSNITESRLAFRTSISIGAVILSKRIADAINDTADWRNGHTYQAYPRAWTASLVVQKAIAEERVRDWGPKMDRLLRARLQACGDSVWRRHSLPAA